jgi:hypothetical protein
MSAPGQGRQQLRQAHEEIKSRNKEARSGVAPIVDDAGLRAAPVEQAWPALQGAAQPDATSEPAPVRERFAGLPMLANGEVSPVALGEMGRPFPKMTTFPEDDARFSSIPVVDDAFTLPLAERTEAPRLVGRAGFDDDHGPSAWNEPKPPIQTAQLNDDAPIFDEVPVIEEAVAFERPVEAAAPRRRFMNRPRQRPARQPLPLADDLLTELYAEPELAPYLEEAERLHGTVAEQPVQSRAEVDQDPLDLNGLLDDIGYEPEPPAYDEVRHEPKLRLGEWGRRAGERRPIEFEPAPAPYDAYDELPHEPRYEYDDVPVHEDRFDVAAEQPIVDDFVVSPGSVVEEIAIAEPPLWSSIPRMCRTCRDFRPAESGERGWCTNKWAFSHRRMVDADELPCGTTIGGWWLPHDESWMTGVDISAHSQPTPLLDHWLALRAAANGEYDAATPIRRRQRS